MNLRRFRMLINVSGVEAYDGETWSGRTVRIGSALRRMGSPEPSASWIRLTWTRVVSRGAAVLS